MDRGDPLAGDWDVEGDTEGVGGSSITEDEGEGDNIKTEDDGDMFRVLLTRTLSLWMVNTSPTEGM